MNGVPPRGLPATAIAVLLAAGALALGACQRPGNVAEAAIQQVTAARAERDRGAVVPASADAIALPAQFPGDVYLPERYSVNSAMDVQGIRVVSLSAPGTVHALFAQAREAMRRQGWTQTLAAQHAPETAMLAFEKGEAAQLRTATLSFNRNNGEDKVIVGVQLRDHRQ